MNILQNRRGRGGWKGKREGHLSLREKMSFLRKSFQRAIWSPWLPNLEPKGQMGPHGHLWLGFPGEPSPAAPPPPQEPASTCHRAPCLPGLSISKELALR